ncbi:MAG: hypothetical protein QM744_16310 [Mesorhizobium sp.]
MKIARRTFFLGTGAFIAAPALADLSAPRVNFALAPSIEPDVERSGELIFKIDGWSVCEPGARDEIWLTADRSWRIAWR